MSTAKPITSRIASLDQFRGYTITAMLVVNFIGGFVLIPRVLKHENTFFSYADSVMPQFLFAVGFSFRLAFGRRAQSQGLAAAYVHMIRRMLGLLLVAVVFEHYARPAQTWGALVEMGPWEALRGPLRHVWSSALAHIAITSLWVLPVIRARSGVRIAWLVASAALQLGLSYAFYFPWVIANGTDGGPLGFLAWALPTLTGTLACDAVTSADGRPRVATMSVWAVVLMALGYALSCGTTLYDMKSNEGAASRDQATAADPVVPSQDRLASHTLGWTEPPFVPVPTGTQRELNYWMMSQRAGTLSYHLFGAGFSLAVYVLFYIACDKYAWNIGLFRTLGSNALVAYLLHEVVGDAVQPFGPSDSPGWFIALIFAIYFGLTYMFVRFLEKNRIYVKL